LKDLDPSNVLALGPVPVAGVDRTFKPDSIKGRTGDTSFVVPRPFTIRAEKCPNRRGVEAILDHFQGSVIDFEEIVRRTKSGEFRALYLVSDATSPWIDEAKANALREKVDYLVVQDTSVSPLAELADAVLAGATFAEKAGCYVNAMGRLQYSEAALPPRDGAMPDLDIFTILCGKGSGPVNSADVLAEAAETVPALAVVEGGKPPRFGVPLDRTVPVGARMSFSDPWTEPRGLR